MISNYVKNRKCGKVRRPVTLLIRNKNDIVMMYMQLYLCLISAN